MTIQNDEALTYFRNNVLDVGFTETDGVLTKKGTNNSTITVTIDQLGVKIKSANESAGLTWMFGSLEGDLDDAFEQVKKLDDKVLAADNEVANDPENIRAARLIHEVRTLNLGPNDKLVVIVDDDVDSDQMRKCSEAMQRWVGDKGAHRVMVMKKAKITKVTDEQA